MCFLLLQGAALGSETGVLIGGYIYDTVYKVLKLTKWRAVHV